MTKEYDIKNQELYLKMVTEIADRVIAKDDIEGMANLIRSMLGALKTSIWLQDLSIEVVEGQLNLQKAVDIERDLEDN